MATTSNKQIIHQADSAASVTPSDDNDLSAKPASLYVGTGGDVKVDMALGDTVTFTNVQSGTFMPIKVKRVYSTGTTASDITALY